MPNLLANGGPMLWVIIFAGAAGIVVFIERALHCHRAQINSTEFLNGVRTVDFVDKEGLRQGVIAPQVHSGGPTEVRFKNFQLELDPQPVLRSVK